MRKITRNNYEEFFLDYLEGSLSALEEIALENFLALHPDLKAELEEMKLVILEEESAELEKESIKEIPFRSNFSDFCIAKLEGDLTSSEEKAFDQFLESNLEHLSEFGQYELTKLKPDYSVIIPDKNKFKKKEKKLIPLWIVSGIGIAASVLILFSIWNNLFDISGVDIAPEQQISQTIQENTESAIIEERTEPVKKVEQAPVAIENSMAVTQHIKETISETSNIRPEEKEIETEKVSIPGFSASTQVKALENVELANNEIKTSQENTLKNSGLAQLGMSWKSSVPKKKDQNSILYAVAKYGVNKLGQIAGKKIQLEKEYDSDTEKTRLNFNTAGLGFSTTVK